MTQNYLLLLMLFAGRLLAQDCQPPGPIVGDVGCITFNNNGNETTYTTVRGKDGKVWLQQNLGSQSVATSATDENGYGDLYQWGRWTDGHQKRNATPTAIAPQPNNPSGIAPGDGFYSTSPEWWSEGTSTDQWNAKSPQEATATNGCDPCKALGSHWSVPTKADWEAIIAAENITNIATAFESSLKLTIAGSKLPSGSFNFTGVRGYYWSKTTSDNDDYAKYLYYSNFIVNPSAGSTRGQGLSVRCIQNHPQYCEVSVDYDVEPISLVDFANLNNATSPIVNATPAYEDFTSMVANVNRGETYTLTVKGNTVGPLEHDIRVFFDWNQDGVYDMDTEYQTVSLLPSTGEDDVTATIGITIPENALLGTTRMRLIKDLWNVYEPGEFDACLNAYYGQVEEYSIQIGNTLANQDFEKKAVSIYPNPTDGLFQIQTAETIKNIRIYNMLGQLVANQKSNTIDLTTQKSGVYAILIEFENGSASQQKIIRK
ncbi:GEVED domain-containing protein [Flavobacterium sp.]|uniref:GEVED domain-containing protein n=1 Tax=Flavobacterium sp. TaxID=239 RepID=UPI0039E2E654